MKNWTNGLRNLACIALTLLSVVAVTGCAGDKNDRSTGEYIDDKSLSVRVHSALSDNSDYKFDNVNVNVYRGTVQLSGFVNNSDQKSKAKDIVKGVQGVKDVDNEIEIKPSN